MNIVLHNGRPLRVILKEALARMAGFEARREETA